MTDAGDGQQPEFTAVVTEEKRGLLHRAIPAMPLPLAVIACILNIILPGTGPSVDYVMLVLPCDVPSSNMGLTNMIVFGMFR